MQSSKYAHAVPAILAEMEQEREEDNNQQPDQTEEVREKVVYIYPLEGGGFVFTETCIEDEAAAPHVVESGEPETDQRPTQKKDPRIFCIFFLSSFSS